MALLTVEQIQAADDLPRVTESVPEWGGEIILRACMAIDNDRYDAALYGADGKMNMISAKARLISACAIKPDGSRLFPDAAHVEMLAKKNAEVIDRLFSTIRRLSNLGVVGTQAAYDFLSELLTAPKCTDETKAEILAALAKGREAVKSFAANHSAVGSAEKNSAAALTDASPSA